MLFGSLAAAAFASMLAGCEPEKPSAPADTFVAPAPSGAGDDPRVAGSNSTGDAISTSLAVIHDRLVNLVSGFRDRGQVEGDLAEVARKMRPHIAAARADCDVIRRAAEDLLVQLPLAQAGYASSGLSYRQRAEGYLDPDLKQITIGIAKRYDRLAADTPRRIALTEQLLKELGRTQSFLAETDRCLRDVETALRVFSGGIPMPPVSIEARGLKLRLGQFISVVIEYEASLRNTPSLPGDAGMGGRPSPLPASPRKPKVVPPGDSAGGTIKQAGMKTGGDRSQPAARRTQLASTSRDQAGPFGSQVWTARQRNMGVEPMPVGLQLFGEVTTPSHSFRNPVALRIVGRDGDTFAAVLTYAGGYAVGRRGVRGRVSPDGRSFSFIAEWYEGNISPEPIRYDLSLAGGRLSGSWATPSLAGTISLEPVRRLAQRSAAITNN